MTVRLNIADGVRSGGVRAEMAVVLQEAPKSFDAFGLDCTLTSLVRPEDSDSLHGWGLAADFDSIQDITDTKGGRIKSDLQGRLGEEYFCLWHLGHLHVEFDPGNRGVAPYRFYEKEA